MGPSPGWPTVLQLLPSDLVVPPAPYLVGLAVAGLLVGTALYRVQPAVSPDLVVAFAPWMVTGAALHALYQLDAAPAVLAPLLSAPAVYGTTFVVACAVWVGLLALESTDHARRLGLAGSVVALAPTAGVLVTALDRGTFAPTWPAIGLVVAIAVTVGIVAVLDRWWPSLTRKTGALGPLVVFAHALDGVSTTIGVDVLGTAERSPLPRAIMDFAGTLPTASTLGSGWLFVLVKVAIAVGVLWVFADLVDETPTQAAVLLGVIAAVGLGPGAHNLLLFAAAGAG
jgi:uncharacterized membrane protein